MFFCFPKKMRYSLLKSLLEEEKSRTEDNNHHLLTINRNCWGKYNSDSKDEEVTKLLTKIETNSNFIFLIAINVIYLLVIILGVCSIFLFLYFFSNDHYDKTYLFNLLITVWTGVFLITGFLKTIRKSILRFYTKKIKEIISEINKGLLINRQIVWEVSEYCKSLSLKQINKDIK